MLYTLKLLFELETASNGALSVSLRRLLFVALDATKEFQAKLKKKGKQCSM